MFDSDEHKLVKQFLGEIVAIPLDRYLHVDLPAELNFTGRREAMKTVLDFCVAASRMDLAVVPAQVVALARQRLEALRNAFRNVLAYTLQGTGEPIERRNNLMRALVAAYGEVYREISGICGHEIYRATVIDDLRDRVEAEVAAITATHQRTVGEVDALRRRVEREADAIVAAARTAAMHSSLVTQAAHFARQAQTHHRVAYGWLATTIAFGALLAAVVYGLYIKEAVAAVDHLVLAQQFGKHVLIISAVTFGAVWASRNYRASLHNWVVNSHRRNALGTFEALAKAVGDDPAARNAILVRSADAIFAPMPSGYVHHDGGESNLGGSHLVEILKAARD
ncbi:MAG TPA: hypothetical protein VEL07_09835 [Planctomycetota bacterium]|nr:hypothetical protein [Planctomycetota bacterium]